MTSKPQPQRVKTFTAVTTQEARELLADATTPFSAREMIEAVAKARGISDTDLNWKPWPTSKVNAATRELVASGEAVEVVPQGEYLFPDDYRTYFHTATTRLFMRPALEKKFREDRTNAETRRDIALRANRLRAESIATLTGLPLSAISYTESDLRIDMTTAQAVDLIVNLKGL